MTHRPRPTNDEIVAAYLEMQRVEKRRTPVTCYQYAAFCDRLLDWIWPYHLGEVTHDQLKEWLYRPRQGRARGQVGSAAVIAKDIAILKGLWRYAIGRSMIAPTTDPTLALVSPPKRAAQPRPIPDDVWADTWARTDLVDEARIVLGLGAFAGLRRMEIANLRGSHVDARTQTLRGFVRKGGGDDVVEYGKLVHIVARQLPDWLPDPKAFFRPLHEQVLASGAGLLLPWGMTSAAAMAMHQVPRQGAANDPQTIYDRFGQWKIPFTPHQLRHSFVTNMLRCGVPLHLVRSLANHASVQTTMGYAKVSGRDLDVFIDTLDTPPAQELRRRYPRI